MPFVEQFIDHYLRLTEHSRISRVAVYGITALLVLVGMDLIDHYLSGRAFPLKHLVLHISEAFVLAVIADHVSHLREKRILRRNRQIQYLNHHVRNALALIKMVEGHLEGKDAVAVHSASDRICGVIEQVSRDEDVCIDGQRPANLRKAHLN